MLMCYSIRNTGRKRLNDTCVLTATSLYLEICNKLEKFHFSHCSEEEKSDNLPKPDSGENEPKRDAVGQPAGPSRDPYRNAPTDPYGDPYRDAYERGMMEGRMRSSDPYYGESHHRYRMYDPYYRRDVERDLYHLDRRQYDPYYRDSNRDLYYTRERDVYPGRERDLYPGRDRYLYPGRDRDFYSGRERDLYPRRESDPYPGRERNLYPARESYNYPGRERDLYPAGERDSSSSRNEFNDRDIKSESADNSITVKIPKPSEEKREKQQSNRYSRSFFWNPPILNGFSRKKGGGSPQKKVKVSVHPMKRGTCC